MVLPEGFHNIPNFTKKMAHLCPEKVIDLARQQFYWPNMATDITKYNKTKCRCCIDKKLNIPESNPNSH